MAMRFDLITIDVVDPRASAAAVVADTATAATGFFSAALTRLAGYFVRAFVGRFVKVRTSNVRRSLLLGVVALLWEGQLPDSEKEPSFVPTFYPSSDGLWVLTDSDNGFEIHELIVD